MLIVVLSLLRRVGSGVLRAEWEQSLGRSSSVEGSGPECLSGGAHRGCVAGPVGHRPWLWVGPKVGRRKEVSWAKKRKIIFVFLKMISELITI